MRVLVTGASGNAGQVVCRLLHHEGYELRRADVAPPPNNALLNVEFVRCDTRTATDVVQAVAGCTAVVHPAAWHSAHNPPVSDATIFAVNVVRETIEHGPLIDTLCIVSEVKSVQVSRMGRRSWPLQQRPGTPAFFTYFATPRGTRSPQAPPDG